MKRFVQPVLILALLGVALLCSAQLCPSRAAPASVHDDGRLAHPTYKPQSHDKLVPVLYELARLGKQEEWSRVEAYAERRGLALRERHVRVVLEAKGGAAPALISRAQAMDLQVESSYRDRVQVWVPVASLLDVADLPSVRRVRLPYRALPLVVTSEGVTHMGADVWHAAGHTGSGVKVAIIDLGFQGYADLIAAGELPANTVTRSFRWDHDIQAGEPHGSACAEVVHDVAPGAQLYLLNFDTDVEFGNAVDYAVSQGIKVVSHSIGWLGAGPFDGTGPICDIVNSARAHGIFWAQAAGNAANKHWEGPWYDPDSDGVHNFTVTDETQSFSISSPTTIYANLVWNDPWGASGNDYDLYLYYGSSGLPVASSTGEQDGNDDPCEFIEYSVGSAALGTYHLVIVRFSGLPRNLELYSFAQVFEHRVASSSLLIPADAVGAVAAGAVRCCDDQLEGFSSRGPANDGRLKPEFVAPDGVSSAVYGTFFGTSAAAPHLAGAAALVRGAYPAYTVAETVAFLTGRSVDLGAAGPDNDYGYGRVSLGPVPVAAPTPTFTATPSRTSAPAGTETVITLQQSLLGYSGAEDTHIYQYAPDITGYYSPTIQVGYKQRHAALLRFDLSSIPSHATIAGARLGVYATGWSGAGASMSFGPYAVLRSTTLSQATWNQAQAGKLWGMPGCNDTVTDRRASPESSLTATEVLRWYDFDLTTLVQSWVNGSLPNNGVLLRASDPNSDFSFYFASAERDTVSQRPRLVITYTAASSPTSTPTPTPTRAATGTPTPTATRTATGTATPTATASQTATPTRTLTPTPTLTQAVIPTHTLTPTRTPTAAIAASGVITLQYGVNGYLGSGDTYLNADDPTGNYCASSLLRVGNKQKYAPVLRFELSSLPGGATINRATLELYALGWSSAEAITIGSYAISPTVTVCEANWNQARVGSAWGQPGCNSTVADRRAIAESVLTTTGLGKWYGFDVTTLAQSWFNRTIPNNGVLIRAEDVEKYRTLTFSFASNEDSDYTRRPRLVISYTVAIVPTATATPTQTATRTATATPTPTPTASRTATSTPSATLSPATATPTSTPTRTPTLTQVATPTYTLTSTPSPTLPIAASGVVTLQHGVENYYGSEDTYIYQYAPDTSYYGAALQVGYKQQYAAALRFPLARLPAGAIITSAALQVYATGWSGGDITIGAYAISRTVTMSQVTWNQAQAGNAWAMPGCASILSDRRGMAESVLTTSGPGRWYAFDITLLARSWWNGSVPNNGLLLRAESTADRLFYFASNESNDFALRPRLVIRYESSGGPTPTATLVPSATSTPTATPVSGRETTITIQQGMYGVSEDTYIYKYAPATNYCLSENLTIGSSQQYAALLRFDLSPIPAGARISRATLQVYANGWNGLQSIIGTYFITRTVSICEANWNQSQTGNLWGEAGCRSTTSDRPVLLESTAKVDNVPRWYDLDLTRAVQSWVDGKWPNNGVLLVTTYPSFGGAFRFASAEHSEVSLRPKLVVTYVTGVPTPTPTTTPFLIIGHITDEHIGRNDMCSAQLPALATLIGQQAHVLVDTGDCTENGTEAETIAYRDHMNATMTIPWQAVQGNHDTPELFARYIRPLAWSWDVGGYRLIGINSESINYSALDAALTTEKPCIVFGHFPLDVYSPADQAALRQRFQAYNVLLYVAGHYHTDSWTTDPTTGTQLLVGHWACGGRYRLITLRGSSVEVTFITNSL